MSVRNGAHVSRGVVGLQRERPSGWLHELRTWSARDIIRKAFPYSPEVLLTLKATV